jgi:hypothetical protein
MIADRKHELEWLFSQEKATCKILPPGHTNSETAQVAGFPTAQTNQNHKLRGYPAANAA